MIQWLLVLFVVIGASIWLRMRETWRRARRDDPQERIQAELRRLRKKRDED